MTVETIPGDMLMLSASAGFHRGRARVCWSCDTANPSGQNAGVRTAIAREEAIVLGLSVNNYVAPSTTLVPSLLNTDMSTGPFHCDRKLVTDGQRPASSALKKAAKVRILRVLALATIPFSRSQLERGFAHNCSC